MEVMIPVSSSVRNRILKMEWDAHVKKIQQTPVNDPVERYEQMGKLGKILMEVFYRENESRRKAFDNPDVLAFIKKFIQVAKGRAKEMGYRYQDMQLSADSGITSDGKILIRFEPVPGAERLGTSAV